MFKLASALANQLSPQAQLLEIARGGYTPNIEIARGSYTPNSQITIASCVAAGANLNHKENGVTPLVAAIVNNQLDIALTILENENFVFNDDIQIALRACVISKKGIKYAFAKTILTTYNTRRLLHPDTTPQITDNYNPGSDEKSLLELLIEQLPKAGQASDPYDYSAGDLIRDLIESDYSSPLQKYYDGRFLFWTISISSETNVVRMAFESRLWLNSTSTQYHSRACAAMPNYDSLWLDFLVALIDAGRDELVKRMLQATIREYARGDAADRPFKKSIDNKPYFVDSNGKPWLFVVASRMQLFRDRHHSVNHGSVAFFAVSFTGMTFINLLKECGGASVHYRAWTEVDRQNVANFEANLSETLAAVVTNNEGKLKKLLPTCKVNISTFQDSEGKTLLACATGQGNEAIVRLLLQHGADPDVACRDGRTPFAIASKNANIPICKILKEYSDEQHRNNYNNVSNILKAVAFAIQVDSPETAQSWLDVYNLADQATRRQYPVDSLLEIDKDTKEDRTLFERALRKGPKYRSLAIQLLHLGANPQGQNRNLLAVAMAQPNSRALVEAMLESQDFIFKWEMGPRFVALVIRGEQTLAELMLQGLSLNDVTKINFEDLDGKHVIYHALDKGFYSLVEALLKAKVPLTNRANLDNTKLIRILLKIVDDAFSSSVNTPKLLETFIENNLYYLQTCSELLTDDNIEYIRDASFSLKNAQALFEIAVMKGFDKIGRVLLDENGAKITQTLPISQKLSLTLAVEAGHIEMVKILLRKWPARVNSTELSDLACQHGHYDLAVWILNFGLARGNESTLAIALKLKVYRLAGYLLLKGEKLGALALNTQQLDDILLGAVQSQSITVVRAVLDHRNFTAPLPAIKAIMEAIVINRFDIAKIILMTYHGAKPIELDFYTHSDNSNRKILGLAVDLAVDQEHYDFAVWLVKDFTSAWTALHKQVSHFAPKPADPMNLVVKNPKNAIVFLEQLTNSFKPDSWQYKQYQGEANRLKKIEQKKQDEETEKFIATRRAELDLISKAAAAAEKVKADAAKAEADARAQVREQERKEREEQDERKNFAKGAQPVSPAGLTSASQGVQLYAYNATIKDADSAASASTAGSTNSNTTTKSEDATTSSTSTSNSNANSNAGITIGVTEPTARILPRPGQREHTHYDDL